MKHFIAMLAVLVCTASPALASEPTAAKQEPAALTDAQLDGITAGFLDFNFLNFGGEFEFIDLEDVNVVVGSIVRPFVPDAAVSPQ